MRGTKTCTAGALLAMLLAFSPNAVPAAEDGDGKVNSGWQFEITPYLWLPETHGTVTVGNLSADVDVDFDDVFDLLGDGDLLGGMGHFEARKDRAVIFVDAWGAVVNAEANSLILRDRVEVDADVDFDVAAVEFGGAYRLLEHGRFIFEGLFGGRYTYVYSGIKVKAANQRRSEDGSADFLDPFVGGRGAIRLAEQWSLVYRGDVGGFGAGSELAWTVIGGVLWEMPWKAGRAQPSLFAGYKAYDLDYEAGVGDRREFDIQMRGPAIGTILTF